MTDSMKIPPSPQGDLSPSARAKVPPRGSFFSRAIAKLRGKSSEDVESSKIENLALRVDELYSLATNELISEKDRQKALGELFTLAGHVQRLGKEGGVRLPVIQGAIKSILSARSRVANQPPGLPPSLRRYAGLLRRVFRGHLIAHAPHILRRRPDERYLARFAYFGEMRILRKEPVTGVYRFHVRYLGGAYYTGYIKV